MIAIIDNYDSFTYNLYQYLGELDENLCVFRNDQITAAALTAMKPEMLVISPGPGEPRSAGISVEAVRALGESIPVLGICLGHQAIGEAFGAQIVPAAQAVHGKVTPIRHNRRGLFQGLPTPLKVARYHSLVVKEEGLPGALEVTARSEGGEIMGLKHKSYPIYGLQFHPESIATEAGKLLIRNFFKLSIQSSVRKAGAIK